MNTKGFLKYLKLMLPALLVTVLVLDAISIYQFPDLSKYEAGVTGQANAAVKKPKLKLKEQKKEEKKEPEGIAGDLGNVVEGTYKDGTYKGSAKGFGGIITVSVTVKNGKIVSIKILSAPGEDAKYMSMARKVIGRMVSKSTTNVDSVSGATYSSNGIIMAVRNALRKAGGNGGGETRKNKKSKQKKKTAALPATDEGDWNDGTYIGAGTGYGGKLKVSVTIKNGKITSIKLLNNNEDKEFLAKAMAKIPDAIIKSQGTNVDTVSGATYSSRGIIAAVRDALKKARKKTAKTQDGKDGDADLPDEQGDGQNATVKKDEPKVPEKVTADSAKWKDGTFTGRGEGFSGDVYVSVTIKDGKISTVNVTKHSDDNEYFSKTSGIPAAIVKAQGTNVDTISGATYSSVGIIEAVNDALKKAVANNNTETDKIEAGSQETEKDTKTSENEQQHVKKIIKQVTVYCDDDEDFEDYVLSVTFSIMDGAIIAISDVKQLVAGSSNDKYINAAVKGLEKQIGSGSRFSKIDTVSGATCTSESIIYGGQIAIKEAK